GFGTDGTLSARPFWFYFPRLAFDFLPWSLLLPPAFWLLWRSGRDDPEARFGAVWLLAVFLLLSCARFKRADYLLPAYPRAALLVGSFLERQLRGKIVPAACAATLLTAALGWSLYLAELLPGPEAVPDTRPFAAAIRQHAPAPHLILFFRAENHVLAYHVG